MNTLSAGSQQWTKGRWWKLIGLVFLGQLAVLFSVTKERFPEFSAGEPSTVFRTGIEHGEGGLSTSWELSDPTVFALPHPHGFSGGLWRARPRYEYELTNWTEPPRWLAPEAGQWGAAFRRYVEENLGSSPVLIEPPPVLGTATKPVLTHKTGSTVRVEGQLAGRFLLPGQELPGIAHGEILTETVVRVSVWPTGETFSPVLLVGSGSKEADQIALDFARSARFEPLSEGTDEGNLGRLMVGRMTFEWLTVELDPAKESENEP